MVTLILAELEGQIVVEPDSTAPVVIGVPRKLTLSKRQVPVVVAIVVGVVLCLYCPVDWY